MQTALKARNSPEARRRRMTGREPMRTIRPLLRGNSDTLPATTLAATRCGASSAVLVERARDAVTVGVQDPHLDHGPAAERDADRRLLPVRHADFPSVCDVPPGAHHDLAALRFALRASEDGQTLVVGRRRCDRAWRASLVRAGVGNGCRAQVRADAYRPQRLPGA